MQLFLSVIFLFVLYSFLGWIIDTGFRSLTAGKYESGSFFPIPFCPVYGVGAIFLLFLHPYLSPLSIVLEFFAYAFILAFLEYGTGVMLKRVFHKRLWKYKNTPFNVATYTDLPHALAWGVLALTFLYLVHPVIATTVYSLFR